MANSALLIGSSRTPYSAVIRLSNTDGTGAAYVFSSSALLAALQNGPLKEVLRRAPAWTVFNPAGIAYNTLRISQIMGGTTEDITQLTGYILTVNWTANTLELTFNIVGAPSIAPNRMYLELRLLSSAEG
jgi:hypothetical protein